MHMDWFAILLHQATVCLGLPGTFGTLGCVKLPQPRKQVATTARKDAHGSPKGAEGGRGSQGTPKDFLRIPWGLWGPRVVAAAVAVASGRCSGHCGVCVCV